MSELKGENGLEREMARGDSQCGPQPEYSPKGVWAVSTRRDGKRRMRFCAIRDEVVITLCLLTTTSSTIGRVGGFSRSRGISTGFRVIC